MTGTCLKFWPLVIILPSLAFLAAHLNQAAIRAHPNDDEAVFNAGLMFEAMGKMDKAADGLEDTGPLSVIGIMANQVGL